MIRFATARGKIVLVVADKDEGDRFESHGILWEAAKISHRTGGGSYKNHVRGPGGKMVSKTIKNPDVVWMHVKPVSVLAQASFDDLVALRRAASQAVGKVVNSITERTAVDATVPLVATQAIELLAVTVTIPPMSQE